MTQTDDELPTPVQGRCGTCNWPTNSLPCPYCAAVARDRRASSLAAREREEP